MIQLKREKSMILEQKRKIVLERKKAMTDLTIENDESSFHRELHNDDDAITA